VWHIDHSAAVTFFDANENSQLCASKGLMFWTFEAISVTAEDTQVFKAHLLVGPHCSGDAVLYSTIGPQILKVASIFDGEGV